MIRAYSVSTPAGIGAVVVGFLLLFAGCSSSNDPFGYQKISGTVTYDDGSKIPGDVYVYFSSLAPAVGNRTPKQGTVKLDPNGDYHDVSSHHYGDGVVAGKLKVTLRGGNNSDLPPGIVPPEYCDVKKTPLELDTSNPASFNFKVHKPSPTASKKLPPAASGQKRVR